MKLLKINFLTLFTVSILMFSCKTECNHTERDVDISCYPNSEKPSQVITYDEMADMMDAYDKGAKKVLNKYMKKISKGKDTISTNYNWYKIDALKQYIAYIERISKEKEIKLTGFRIYPTSYPMNYSEKNKRGRQTIIFTPTTLINNKHDVAFEPLYSEKGKPVEITKFLEQVRAKKVFTGSINPLSNNRENGLESSSANRVNTTPPFTSN